MMYFFMSSFSLFGLAECFMQNPSDSQIFPSSVIDETANALHPGYWHWLKRYIHKLYAIENI